MTFLDDIVGPIPSVPLIEDAVVVRVGPLQRTYEGWESLSIGYSIDSIAGSFQFKVVEKWREINQDWPLLPGSQVAISIDNETVLVGYIDSLDVSTSNEDRTMNIRGRNRCGDLVDNSVSTLTSEFKNISLEGLAEELLGIQEIEVLTETNTGEKFKKFTVNQGETVFDCLNRAARNRGVLLTTNPEGNLVITNRAGIEVSSTPSISDPAPTFDFVAAAASLAGISSAGVSLVQGENVLTARAAYDHSNRFQSYLAKGSSRGTDANSGSALSVQATAKDKNIKRTRTKIVLAEGNVDKDAVQRRANWEAVLRAAESTEVEVTVQGWRKTIGGDLWKPNESVEVSLPYIGVSGQLLIRSVSFTKDLGGTITSLSLTRPDAYSPEAEIVEEEEPGKIDDSLAARRRRTLGT